LTPTFQRAPPPLHIAYIPGWKSHDLYLWPSKSSFHWYFVWSIYIDNTSYELLKTLEPYVHYFVLAYVFLKRWCIFW